jgi:hypothetical protein
MVWGLNNMSPPLDVSGKWVCRVALAGAVLIGCGPSDRAPTSDSAAAAASGSGASGTRATGGAGASGARASGGAGATGEGGASGRTGAGSGSPAGKAAPRPDDLDAGPEDASPGGEPADASTASELRDPGTGPWNAVATDQVREACKLDPDVLAGIAFEVPWLVVRYGQVCWAGGGALSDEPAQNFSATKTLGAATLGMIAYDTRDIPRTERKTGPLLDTDRADFWLDAFSYNNDALLGHVLGMEAHNADLSYGQKKQSYDTIGDVQINSLSTVMNAAIAQDTARLGSDLDAYAKQRVFARLGMQDSTWDTTDLSGITGWFSGVGDMARLGLLLIHGGMWSGERLIDASWVYKMTHPSFEDGNTAYGYLTWLNARNNWHLAGLEDFTGGAIGPAQQSEPLIACAPAAINAKYPHPPSDAPDCNYAAPATCAQEFDVGAWEANGLGGQLIMGHPGLDLVIVTRNFGDATGEGLITMGSALWDALVPAIVAEDPAFKGDRAGFCAAYERGSYAPDLR